VNGLRYRAGLPKEKQMDQDATPAQALNLATMIDYQRDTIVSKTLIDKKTGTLTLFAFWEGQALSEHTAPFDAVVYLLDGDADITVSGKPIHVKNGEVVTMPANQPHALKASKNFKMLLIMIKS
jgi:quercetin dioxygenase-like cupin family protein